MIIGLVAHSKKTQVIFVVTVEIDTVVCNAALCRLLNFIIKTFSRLMCLKQHPNKLDKP